MDEQNAVRGQGFTLMVFGGLVALCSVFFILGMVVGRSQGTAAVDPATESVSASQLEAEEPELEFYDAVREDEPRETTPAPSPPPRPVPPPPVPEPDAEPVIAVAPTPNIDEGAIVVQLGAFGVEATADRVAAEAREAGFMTFVLRPGEASAYHRVQVGPYRSEDEASRIRSQLQAAGFDSIIVR